MPYVLLFVLICGLFGLLIGLWKGARKKISGICAIVFSVLISMLITQPIIKVFFTEETIGTIVELLDFTDQYNDLLAVSPSVAALVQGIPIALAAPIIFIPIYLILRLLFRIIFGAVSKSLLKDKSWAKSKIIGMPLGFLQGVLSAMVFVAIIAGFVSMANSVCDVVVSQEAEALDGTKEVVAEIDPYINIVADDPLVKILDKTNFVFDHLNSFKLEEDKVVLNDEITTIVDAAINLLPLSENTDISTWSNDEYVALETFVEKFGKSSILPQISSEILSAACEKWANGETFMGIEAPKTDEMINPLIVTLYATLRNSNSDTIITDLGTLVDILKIVGKYDLLSTDTSDIMSKLNGALISELLSVISTNDHFSILIPEVTNLSIRLLASTINLPANTGEVYNNITSSISTDLNAYLTGDKTEESVQELKNNVTKTLQQNGIEVSDEVAAIVTDTMTNAFAEKETVTQEDIENYFIDYAIIYSSVEGTETNEASANSPTTLSASMSSPKSALVLYDYKTMTYDEKIAAISAIGLLDYYQMQFDLSAADNMLANGMTANQFTDYILAIYNAIVEAYNEISALGTAEENPVISLQSAETIKTNKTTTESLLVNAEDYTLSDKDIENIAEGFESITSFIDSYNKIEGDISLDNLSELDLEAMGKALDLLQDTDLLGETIGDMADAIITEVTGTNVSISESVNNGDASFESLMTTVKNTSDVIANLSNSDKTEEEKNEAILELLLNLTPETSGVISEIVTEDFMISFGIPAEFAYASTKAMKIALVEMANLSEAEHDAEAAKLQRLFELASSAGSTDKALVGENGIFKSEDDIIDMMVNSKVVYKTIVSISTDKNGAEIKDAFGFSNSMSAGDKQSLCSTIIDYYNANKASTTIPDLADRLNAVATLLDLDLKIN